MTAEERAKELCDRLHAYVDWQDVASAIRAAENEALERASGMLRRNGFGTASLLVLAMDPEGK